MNARELAAALARHARADAGELWEEARAEALAVARRRLIEAYADAVVQAALDREPLPQPTAPVRARDEGARADVPADAPDLGCYVYAVVDGNAAGAVVGTPGLDPGRCVDVVSFDGLSAVVSDVDIEALRAAGADVDVAEGGRLVRVVRAHEQVVTAAFACAPTVPMRFGIVYPTRADAERVLRRHAQALRAELDRVGGAGEWTLKIWVDVATLRERLADAEPEVTPATEAGRTGTTYLLQHRARRQIDERVETYVSARIEGLAAALESKSRDWTDVTPGQAVRQGRPLLARAFLVDAADVPRFNALVDDFAGSTHDMGVQVLLDGPLPAYHFTRLRLESPDA